LKGFVILLKDLILNWEVGLQSFSYKYFAERNFLI
jgi:hypothetical protein